MSRDCPARGTPHFHCASCDAPIPLPSDNPAEWTEENMPEVCPTCGRAPILQLSIGSLLSRLFGLSSDDGSSVNAELN